MHEYTYITQAPAHLNIIIDYTQQNLQPTFTDNKQGLEAGKIAVWSGKHGSSTVLENKILQVKFEGSEFLLERKRKVILCRVAEDRNSAGTNSGNYGTRNLQAR